MATTINERIIEIVEWTEREEQDPVRAVQDYLLEKDSRITRAEAKRLVGQAKEVLLAKTHLLEAMVEHERVAGQIYTIAAEDVETYLNKHPDLAAKLVGLDPEVVAWAIEDAIGALGILEMVENTIQETILAVAAQPGSDPRRNDP